MNSIVNRVKKSVQNKKGSFVFLVSLIIVGFIAGSLFLTILDKLDKEEILTKISNYFTQIKNSDFNYRDVFINSLISNLFNIILIWILGFSIIGVPIIIFMIFFKGFIIGFSITSIIYKYKFIGILGSLIYIFPHHIINILLTLFIGYFSLKLSSKLFKAIIYKTTISFKDIINKYLLVFAMSLVIGIVSSLFEVFISPLIIKMFMFLFK